MATKILRNGFVRNIARVKSSMILENTLMNRLIMKSVHSAAYPSVRAANQLGYPISQTYRQISCSAVIQQNISEEDSNDEPNEDIEKTVPRQEVDLETSIEYMSSQSYEITYGDKLVWEPYKRNFKGRKPRAKTRKTCIRAGQLATGNPCPICRDQYLVVDPKNTALLKQFVSPYTGEVISYEKTGVCQKQHKRLLMAVHQAWDAGYLEMPLPHRHYNYSDYYPEYKDQEMTKSNI